MKCILLSVLIVLSSTQAIADTNSDPDDYVNISKSTTDQIGPGGMTVSCVEIAWADKIQNKRYVYGGSSDVYDITDNQKSRKQRFAGNEKFFNVRFQDWTPETVEFLKNAIDKCVTEKHPFKFSSLFKPSDSIPAVSELSPSSSKQLIDDIYAIALATKHFDAEQVEQRRQYALQKQKQEQEHIQNDEARGYHTMSFTDFQLDAKSIRTGKKLSISGYYEINGNIQSLTEKPSQIQILNAYKLFLLSEDAPRDTRKQLIDLQNRACGKYLICQITVLGHVQRCSETMFGKKIRDTICLAVDDIRLP